MRILILSLLLVLVGFAGFIIGNSTSVKGMVAGINKKATPTPTVFFDKFITIPTDIPDSEQATTENSAAKELQITCTGPDGKQFQVTQQECDSFNAAWKNKSTSQTSTSQNNSIQMVDCYYKNDSGVMLYNFGVVSEQKCKDLQNDWWNKKQNEVSSSNRQFCTDQAMNNAKTCEINCSGSDNACWNQCSTTFQEALSKCK